MRWGGRRRGDWPTAEKWYTLIGKNRILCRFSSCMFEIRALFLAQFHSWQSWGGRFRRGGGVMTKITHQVHHFQGFYSDNEYKFKDIHSLGSPLHESKHGGRGVVEYHFGQKYPKIDTSSVSSDWLTFCTNKMIFDPLQCILSWTDKMWKCRGGWGERGQYLWQKWLKNRPTQDFKAI